MQCIGAVGQIIQKTSLYHCQLLYSFSEKWYDKTKNKLRDIANFSIHHLDLVSRHSDD